MNKRQKKKIAKRMLSDKPYTEETQRAILHRNKQKAINSILKIAKNYERAQQAKKAS